MDDYPSSGIYMISHDYSDKAYIGYSKNIQRRYLDYNKNRNINKNLQREINKFGIDEFTFFLLEEVEEKKLKRREIFWIQVFKELFGGDNLYNENYNI